MQGNRAHTYLGPIDHAEAVGKGTAFAEALPRLRRDRQGLRLRRRHVRREGGPVPRSKR
jgi:hypothetical protein